MQILPKRNNKHPNSHWHWWQALAAALIGLGIFGAVIGLVPPFSLDGLKLGLTLTAFGTIAGLWNWWTYNWWARLTMGVIWTLMIAAITARAWMAILSTTEIWIIPLFCAFFLGWLLPAISPSISNFLWEEQTSPKTRVGRLLLAVGISIAPVAGVIGASIGMFGSRLGDIKGVLLAGAILGMLATIILPFTISYQLWPERPWSKKELEERI